MLLDDVFSELDGSRRIALTKILNKHQVFITTTDADIIFHRLVEKATIIPLAQF
jgi:recombinational DNA repair ATPase RecF